MKKITLIICSCFIVTSCAVSKYEYDLDMIKPKESKELTYSDEILSINFELKENHINFKLNNISEKPLKVLWDDASYVKNGEAQKIIHKNIKYMDKEKTQAATVVPARSFIYEMVQPIDAIRFNTITYGRRHSSYWSTKPIFSVASSVPKKRILTNLGSTINIYLPIQTEGKTIDYYFEMEVKDILLRTSKKKVKSIIE